MSQPGLFSCDHLIRSDMYNGWTNKHQHQKQQDSGARFLSLWQRRRFSYRVNCYNVRHDGGIAQKTVEDTLSDGSGKEVLNFGDSWEVIQQQLTK